MYSTNAAGPYSLIATIPVITQTSYTHNTANPISTNNFYYIVTQSGPSSITDISSSSDTLQALLNTPSITYVTVDQPSKFAHIYWTPDNSPKVQGYVIYKRIGINWISMGTVIGKSSNSFINVNSTANSSSETYTVASYDSIHCPDLSPMSKFHHTLFLQNSLDVCNAQTTLSWNSYTNMIPDVNEYRVYCSDNGGAYHQIASLAATELSYTHTNLQSEHTYCYYVEALNGVVGVASQSNIICATPHMPSQANYCYLQYATVTSPTSVEIAFFIDTSAYTQHINFYKSIDSGTTYTLLLPIPVSTNPLMFFNDNIVNTNTTSYVYKAAIVDSCGIERIVSNIGKTILLKCAPNRDMTNILTWTTYHDWNIGVDSYNIYRKVGSSGSFEFLKQISSALNIFIDDISDVREGDGQFCYYIEAIELDGNKYKFKETSKSNEVCVQQYPKLFVPNAFVYGGLTPTFKPICLFVTFEKYMFLVYNRIGELIFQTNDPNLGWDGKFNGKKCPQGVYVYSVEYENKEGKSIQRTGSVTLIE